MSMEKYNGWKIASIFGIPLTAILTWAFVAGGVLQDIRANSREIDSLKSSYASLDARIRTVELGIVRIEVQYQNISKSLDDIKVELQKK